MMIIFTADLLVQPSLVCMVFTHLLLETVTIFVYEIDSIFFLFREFLWPFQILDVACNTSEEDDNWQIPKKVDGFSHCRFNRFYGRKSKWFYSFVKYFVFFISCI